MAVSDNAAAVPTSSVSPDPEPLDPAGPADSTDAPPTPGAWARFEFETGCGNEGTKVLMVEWNAVSQDGSSKPKQGTPNKQDQWEISWQGKTSKFAISEQVGVATHRVFFLIPGEDHVPPVVTISLPATGQKLSTKPMPAIYMPALGADASRDAGTRGVLHTMWAKRRLSQLQGEIEQEMKANSEGVALQMALADRDYIVEHFGLEHPDSANRDTQSSPRAIPPTPQSPRSPIGGRLGEKLRGLKLATSPSDLANPGGRKHHLYTLSPDVSDIAVPAHAGAYRKHAQQQTVGSGELASLNALVGGSGQAAYGGRPPLESHGTEDELFALPMSPRSPEMKKSPFSSLK
ncbi:hypothetical protein JX266_008266 [Neoarthrinium moseri]|uniref:uncharacterized protein n=1 Tax=Neoarthrinium moseri TaxID=1658444 RepID=UPI001FDDD8C8|nr:uncharacterized protein JN550_006198 [Neoarthrinium moseri]KAI1845655.1 hypothetical protein JX266_008266 [Neoarthrinium moseri]KAI1868623.1 hypothetical protein JN550_006198 [Neoarthrinium moseri]